MAFLKIMSGAQTGTKYDIDKDETVIGRAIENAIVLDEPAVSHKHCAIIRDGKRFTLRDVGSTNGTRLNENKVTDSRLKPKDLIAIGSVEMVFDGDDIESPPQIAAATPPPTQTTRRTRTVSSAPPGTAGASPAVGADSPFGKRREHKVIWISLTVLIGALALGAFVWFLCRLFKMG